MHVRANLNSHTLLLTAQHKEENNRSNLETPLYTESPSVTDTHCIASVDASFILVQGHTGQSNTGLGLYLKGRLQGLNFRLKIQAQANQISNPIEAEAQAILLAVQVNSAMNIQTGTIFSDNQQLIDSLNDSRPVFNAPN